MHIPEIVDAWRMVAERRQFQGSVPLETMNRLNESLADAQGVCEYSLEFGRDTLNVPYLELKVVADLPLICQRSLERFSLPIRVDQRLGLIIDEAEEAALPPGYEPLLVPKDGQLGLIERVEDELLLALPVIPVAAESTPIDREWSPTGEEKQVVSPFAVLTQLKKQ